MRRGIIEALEKTRAVCEVAHQIERYGLDPRNPETEGMVMWFSQYLVTSLNEWQEMGRQQDNELDAMLEHADLLSELHDTILAIRGIPREEL